MLAKPVILITGASAGIGAATARLFGQQGYRVVLAARRSERLEELAAGIRSVGGEALVVPTDLSRREEIIALASAALDQFGQIDILFNNAGFGRFGWLEELEPAAKIDAQIQINLIGVIETTQAVLPSMIARGRGHIINMSSLAGWIATPTYSIYAASKFGVRGFTEALRREVGVYGIRVSGIYPGAVATEFSQHTGDRRKTGIKTPSSLRLTSEQVALAIWKLARHPRRSVVIPGIMWLVIWINSLLPWAVDWLIERRFVRRERTSFKN
jgi:short-subunit dehydrogenase